MVKLRPLENHLAYAGGFEKPVMELWGATGLILEGLLDALEGFGTQLSDMEVITYPASPSDHRVTINLGARAQLEFKLGGMAAEVSNFNNEDVSSLASALAAAEVWLKSAPLTQTPKFSSHVATVTGHYEMEGTTASEFLAARSDLALRCLGRNMGSGIVYHGELAEGITRVQLSVDHSVIHEGALFLRFGLITVADSVKHEILFRDGEALVMDALKELGLEISALPE